MKIVLHILAFLILTALTQVGGLIYLVTIFVFSRAIDELSKKGFFMIPFFLGLYLLTTFLLVPLMSNRVALPILENQGISPVTVLTCLLNRHYVDPELYEVLREVSGSFPHTIQYMDANFPFFDGFPLLPHLSHDDGEKVDLAFQYGTGGTDLQNFRLPTFLGYGSFELPEEDEEDMATQCRDQGEWQYSMTELVPTRSTEATFHHYRTQRLIKTLARHPSIKKIFLEPHLKSRLGLTSNKVRFHGCHAVRHDDHIHVEL